MLHALSNASKSPTSFNKHAKRLLFNPILDVHFHLFKDFNNEVKQGKPTDTPAAVARSTSSFILGNAADLDAIYSQMEHGFAQVQNVQGRKQRVISLMTTTIKEAFAGALDVDTLMVLHGNVMEAHHLVTMHILNKNKNSMSAIDFHNTVGQDLTKFGLDAKQYGFIREFMQKLREIMGTYSVAFASLPEFDASIDGNVGDKTDAEILALLDDGVLLSTVSEQFQALIATVSAQKTKQSGASKQSGNRAKSDDYSFWNQTGAAAATDSHNDTGMTANEFLDSIDLKTDDQDVSVDLTLNNKQRMSKGLERLLESGGVWLPIHIKRVGEVLQKQPDDLSAKDFSKDLMTMIVADKRHWTQPHLDMLKIVIAEPQLTKQTIQKLLKYQLTEIDGRLKKSAVPQAHQEIFNFAKSHGKGDAQLRFHHNAADSDVRMMLDKYFTCNRPARNVDLALKKQNEAMRGLLKSNTSLDNMGILNLLSTS